MGREAILNSIKSNKPELVNIPNINIQLFDEEIDLLETFKNNVKLVGGSVAELNQINNLDAVIKKLYPNAKNIVTHLTESNLGTVAITSKTTPHSLKEIDLTIIKGEFGVSENGAVWISEDQFPIRVLPFITNDLVILLQKESLCLHMYNAYKKIFDRRRTFGLFISGPSKTADIEQCLVIGAQGAMNLTVILV